MVSNRNAGCDAVGNFCSVQTPCRRVCQVHFGATDEIAGLQLSKAQKYARNQLPPYEGEKWDVINDWQIEAAKQAQPELNQMLKKVGGDPLVGLYLVLRSVNYHGMPDKIRYAVNVGKL